MRDRKRGKRWGLHSCFNTLSECIFLERSIGILDTKFGKGLRTGSDSGVLIVLLIQGKRQIAIKHHEIMNRVGGGGVVECMAGPKSKLVIFPELFSVIVKFSETNDYLDSELLKAFVM